MYRLELTDDEVTILKLALRAFDETEFDEDMELAATLCDNLMDKLMSLGA